MTVGRTRVVTGDCRAGMQQLAPESVHAVITSVPYLWLRCYGTEPQVWGDPGTHEAHEWQPCGRLSPGGTGERSIATSTLTKPSAERQSDKRPKGSLMGWRCTCGAWRGELGLEPTVELYVAHLVEVFREVRRVLRKDGVVWLNIGDSYAGSGKGPTGHNGIGDQAKRQGFTGEGPKRLAARAASAIPEGATRGQRMGSLNGEARHTSGVTPPPGYKAKDLLLVPYRVALALQADGWYVRSDPPWIKRNAMPESVTDRFASAKEVLFQLSKAKRYFWDPEAVCQGVSGTAHARGNGVNPKATSWNVPTGWDTAEGAHDKLEGRYKPKQNASFSGAVHALVTSRNRRNTDAFFESLDDLIDEQRRYLAHLEDVRARGGLLLDEEGDPLALLVNARGFAGAHFATFSERFVEPLIKSSTSEKGCCPACGAPWRRVVEKHRTLDGIPCDQIPPMRNTDLAQPSSAQGVGHNRIASTSHTKGWAPGCTCEAGSSVPCEVLDPFFGAGTVGVVANRLGRNCTGIELKPDYADMSVERNVSDAPLFADVERVA